MRIKIMTLIFMIAMLSNSTIYAAPRVPSQARSDRAPMEYQNPETDYNAPKSQSPTKTTEGVMATRACNVNAFATSDTAALINEIKTQGCNCVNELFGAPSSTQISAFSSNNMYAVANHTAGLAGSYSGNGDPALEALFLFIRAGYFAEYYNTGITFASWVKPAVKSAIDAFVNNSNFYNNNDGHGSVLQEVITTMDSSEQQDVYLYVVKEWLSRWNSSYATSWYMCSAVNGIFTIIFRGYENPNFVSMVGNDTVFVDRLASFTMNSWMINSDSEYMISNAASELGRLKRLTGTAIQPSVDAALRSIFSTYQMFGYGDAVWLGAAGNATYYGNCADYNICGYGDQLESKVLVQNHTCSPTLKIRSQNLTSVQQSSICTTLSNEESYFHSRLQTGNVPVVGDVNTQLNVNVFDSPNDYVKYAGPIFDIDTNNGGMYLEGNPSTPGNIPNFVAYEASYGNPDHYVWNLEHEYVHYLDGRFNMAGGFNDPTEKVVWWAEGLAEYISKQNYNPPAIDTINDGSTETLSNIIETTYDSGEDLVYRWSYLAMRFMFEKHFSDIRPMIDMMRTGNWTGYKSIVVSWGSNYGNEFTTWTQSLNNTPPTINNPPVAHINGPFTGNVNESIAMSGAGSFDSDGSIVSYSWNFGDGASATGVETSHSYAANGSYTVTLTVTDNENAVDRVSTQVEVGSTIPVPNTLQNGVPVSNLSANTGDFIYYAIDVPSTATNLVISISGGTGDADLFTQFNSQPTEISYQCRPYASGNNESCTEATPSAGVWYIGIQAYSTFSGLTLTASYDDSGNNIPPIDLIDACLSQSPLSGGPLANGVPVCLGSQDPMWFTIDGINGHSSMRIRSGHGTGDLSLEYSDLGWPDGTNLSGSSYNAGNGECIYVTNQSSQYYGYLKVSGTSSGATLIVDFDTAGCQ